MIVVDRRDLKTQISDDFDACDYPNVEKALGVDDLKSKLKTDWRGTLVTTVQSFQKMGDLPPLDRRQHHHPGGRVPPLAKGQERRELRDDDAGETAERFSLRLHRHAHRPDDDQHPSRFRPDQGRPTGALSQLLRHQARDQGRCDARSALSPRQGAVDRGRAGVERRLRADVRGDGTGGRGSERPDPAPALAVEGTGPPSRPGRDRHRQDAHPLPGLSRPERLQGATGGRGPSGLRPLQGCAGRQTQGPWTDRRTGRT